MNDKPVCFLSLTTIILLLAATPSVKAQTFSILYNFGVTNGDPLNPGLPGLIAQGRDGSLYSTTSNGGINGLGTVFRITPAGKLKVIYNFDGPHGQAPLGGLTLGTDGKFYGTTWYGGASGSGTIFSITPSGTLTVLYSFMEFSSDSGFQPYAPPIRGADGNLYGTAGFGGSQGAGTVYKITPTGQFTVLHAFGGPDGSAPIAPLVQGNDGAFYGTTQLGGSSNSGVVFKITSSGVFTILSDLDGATGGNPYAPVIQAYDGNFFGTASGWGGFGWGTIYKMTPAGSLNTIYNFTGNSDSGAPYAGLIQATNGKLYGAASGDPTNSGTLFNISETGTFSLLHSFDGTHGSDPTVTPFQHTNGLLYGATTCGGTGATGGCVDGPGGGVFYSLDLGLPPFVSFVNLAGRVGSTVEVLGQGLTGTTAVAFGGVLATKFQVFSDTFMAVLVPSGAKSGAVTVSTPSGTLKSNKRFIVIN